MKVARRPGAGGGRKRGHRGGQRNEHFGARHSDTPELMRHKRNGEGSVPLDNQFSSLSLFPFAKALIALAQLLYLQDLKFRNENLAAEATGSLARVVSREEIVQPLSATGGKHITQDGPPVAAFCDIAYA
jgi:hypothetical protein